MECNAITLQRNNLRKQRMLIPEDNMNTYIRNTDTCSYKINKKKANKKSKSSVAMKHNSQTI